ncbi:hypothetical protein PI124_g14478 [Phytophthora idaei]|nr:hypothetical protein PI125_g18504 [Phytophthora idaei]KAG3240614.1 hypothetical protein PI124_g14478 [Phytophthora idaei]
MCDAVVGNASTGQLSVPTNPRASRAKRQGTSLETGPVVRRKPRNNAYLQCKAEEIKQSAGDERRTQ